MPDEIKGKVGENLQAALPRLPLSMNWLPSKPMLICTANCLKACTACTAKAPKWSQLAVEFKRLNFRTWLKKPKPASAKATAKICLPRSISANKLRWQPSGRLK